MTTSRKWRTGWGVGCGVLLLGGVGACVAAGLFLKHTFRGIEKAASSYDELVDELGGVGEYVPPAAGTPTAERLETFLRVREVTADARSHVDALAARLPSADLAQEGTAIGRIRVGLRTLGDLIDGIGSYLQARNRAMLEREMGVGEYVYLYTLTYHSWLGHSPTEAPQQREGPDGVRVGVFPDGDALFGEAAVRRRYRRYILGMVRAQLASTGREAEAGAGDTWRAGLQRELHRLEMDPGHVLWQDGLPEGIEAALVPHRGRLEATWGTSTNRVELPLAEHETPWEWR